MAGSNNKGRRLALLVVGALTIGACGAGAGPQGQQVSMAGSPADGGDPAEVTVVSTTVATAGTTASTTTPAPAPTTTAPAITSGNRIETTVLRVVDGDTLEVDRVGPVRLAGIDTAEVVAAECGGDWASHRLAELSPIGSTVVIEIADKVTTDQYGRTLGYVFTPSGLHVGEALVLEGWAKESHYDNDKYRAAFVAAQKQAKAADIGAWSACQWNPTTTTAPAPPPTTAATRPTSTPPVGAGTYYANCDAARAAGAAPLFAGEPGYRSGLDRDSDGIACE